MIFTGLVAAGGSGFGSVAGFVFLEQEVNPNDSQPDPQLAIDYMPPDQEHILNNTADQFSDNESPNNTINRPDALDEDDDDENLNDAFASSPQSRYVSCCEFYSAKLMRHEDSHFHYFGRLYQQFVVDSYLKVENQKLKYLKFNQAKLRLVFGLFKVKFI
jgi:hypothetical protein